MFLKKARQNAENIISEIDSLSKEIKSLTKKEISRNHDTLATYIDNAMENINTESKEMTINLKKHRNFMESKTRFIKRHYKIG
ncbi:MAG: hypothetical protein HYT73_02900 [Candidatus Aenigmarchaeota archaeon]|nr:hypothetical protein [Candidatus Aenigmarchaeota archaeon]